MSRFRQGRSQDSAKGGGVLLIEGPLSGERARQGRAQNVLREPKGGPGMRWMAQNALHGPKGGPRMCCMAQEMAQNALYGPRMAQNALQRPTHIKPKRLRNVTLPFYGGTARLHVAYSIPT